MTEWLMIVLCAALACAVVCLWRQKARAEREKADVEREKAEVEKRLVVAEAEKKSSESLMQAREEHYRTTLDQGAAQFRELAQEILEDREKKLAEEGAKPLGDLVGQLKRDIEALKANLREVDKNSATTHTKLMAEIEKLMSETGSVTREANNLAEAIRGDAQLTGEWGEIQLRRVLDLAGLVETSDYTYQETFRDDETGRRSRRTDFVIKMPGDRSLIIDSKSTVAAAERYHGAADEAARAEAAAEIVASVRGHVDEIVAARYQEVVPNAFSTVLMYIPLEEVYLLAMKATVSVSGEKETLRDYARRRNVVFVNSASVVPVVRLVEMMWNVERTEKNREETIRAAEELLQRANDFVSEFLSVGESFKDVFAKYEQAKRHLVDAPGGQSITKAVAKLVRLGVQPRKRGGKVYELAAPVAEEV
jgi:DNA recombination protein RmuC